MISFEGNAGGAGPEFAALAGLLEDGLERDCRSNGPAGRPLVVELEAPVPPEDRS